jgi:uncharacterized protein (TIGR02145 family)
MKKTFVIILALSALIWSCQKDEDPIESITIGSQVWMKKNLNVDHYRNGDEIPQVTDTTEWANLTTGAWCYYNNSLDSGKIYGKLYNWYAVNDPRGLAPAGWHVPSYAELIVLRDYLGGEGVAGGKMKETGTTHWKSPNNGATNSSGFTGLPGSLRYNNGYFISDFGNYGNWWSSTEYNMDFAWCLTLSCRLGNATIRSVNERSGFSLRCLKD